MATHIQLHRSAIGGATPDVGNMLEGEPAVNLTDKKFYVRGASAELITLIDGETASLGSLYANGTVFASDVTKLGFSAGANIALSTSTVGDEKRITISSSDRASTIAGSNKEVQYNASDGFSADAKFLYDSVTNVLSIGNGGMSADGATFGVKGATFGGNIVLQNNDYISNPSAYTVRMMPEGTSSTDYGLEFEFSDWGYGSVITSRKASDGSNAGSIRFDSSFGPANDKDLVLGNSSHSRFRHTQTGNNTLQVGVSNDDADNCSGAFALINTSHLGQAYRSPSDTHANPNFYVYANSTDANEHIRFEHDGTDANIVTGAGNISLQAANESVVNGASFSEGGATFGTKGITVGGNIHLDGDVIMTNQGSIKVEGDTESIYMNAGGGQFVLSASAVDIKQKLRHMGDTNTYLDFTTERTKFLVDGNTIQDMSKLGVTFGDYEVAQPKLKDYSESFYDNGNVNGVTLDFENGNVQIATGIGSGSTSSMYGINLTNPPATGTVGTMTLILNNGVGMGQSGGHMFASEIQWPGGNAPSLSNQGHDVLTFMTTNAGATYYGFVGGINFS